MKHNIDYFGLKTFYGGRPTPTPTPDTGSVTPIDQHIIIPNTKIDELFDDDTSDSFIYSIMRGATAQHDGSQGLVPMPRIGDQVKFLRGDGAWGIPINTNTTYDVMTGATSQLQGGPGLVPKPVVGDQVKFLRGDGTWAIPTDTNTTYDVMTGAAAGAAGKQGLVPTPAVGHQASYLRGDGQWVAPINDVTATSAGYVLDARVGKTLNDKFYTPIPSNTDLNTVTTPGFYAAISSAVASSLINCPTEYGFTMLVMQHGTTINQIIFGPGTVSAGIYMRTQTSTGFQPWFLIDSNTTSDFDVSDSETAIYNSNSYASETAVKRISIHKRTKWFGILYFNFVFDTASFPQSSNNVWLTIGHFDRLKPKKEILQALCPQGGSNNYGNLLLNITTGGLINIYNSNTMPCSGWYRTDIPIIFN